MHSSKFQYISISLLQLTSAFNIDPQFQKLTGPQNSLFGFSLSNHLSTNSLLVGAPTDNQHGSIYKCANNLQNLTDFDKNCQKISIDESLSKIKPNDKSKRNFLGGTIVTDIETGRVLVCAHGYTEKSDYYEAGLGKCILLNKNLKRVINADQCPCRGKLTTNKYDTRGSSYNYQGYKYCMAGLSAAFSSFNSNDNYQSIVMTTPGAFTYTGGLVSMQSQTLEEIDENYAENFFGEISTFVDEKTGVRHNDTDVAKDFSIDTIFELDCDSVKGINKMECNQQLGFTLKVEKGLFPRLNSTIEYFLSTAPLTGKLYIMTRASGRKLREMGTDFSRKHEVKSEIKTEAVISGESLGHFGGSLEVMDVDGDGLRDILVGVPGDKTGGLVLIYKNRGNIKDTFETPEWKLASPHPMASFGKMIKNVGDVNRDGVSDFVVGASEYSDSFNEIYRPHGAVFIYHGKKFGEKFEKFDFQQIIMDSSKSSKGFGISAVSLPGNNGYPKLAIGTLSDEIYIYKSRPIISTNVELEIDTLSLDPKFKISDIEENLSVSESGNIFIKVGVKFSVTYFELTNKYEKPIKMSYNLTIDEDNFSRLGFSNRGSFDMESINSQKQGELEARAGTDDGKNIYNINFYIPINCDQSTNCELQFMDLLNPIKLTLSLETINLSDPVFENPENSQIQKSGQILLKKQCGDDNICQSHLQLATARFSIQKSDSEYLDLPSLSGLEDLSLAPEIYMELGTEKSVILDIDLKNSGEDAHQSGLLILLPDEVEFINHVDQSCHETNQTNLLSCWLGNPFQSSQTKTLSIQFKRKQKDLLKDFEISAEFITTSEFSRFSAKKIVFPVKVRIAASLEVLGYTESGSEVIQYTGSEVGLDYVEKYRIQKGSYFNHVFRLENTGTSSLEEVLLEVDVPVKLKNGKFLCFIEGYSLMDYYGRELNETTEFDIELVEKNWLQKRNLDDLELILPENDQIMPEQYDLAQILPGKRNTSPEKQNLYPSTFKNSGKLIQLNCQNPEKSFLSCSKLFLTIFKLPPGPHSSLTFTLKMQLWNTTFIQEFFPSQRVKLQTSAKLKLSHEQVKYTNAAEKRVASVTTQISADKTILQILTTDVGKIEPWVFALTVFIGLVMLTFVTVVCHVCGFFRSKWSSGSGLWQQGAVEVAGFDTRKVGKKAREY